MKAKKRILAALLAFATVTAFAPVTAFAEGTAKNYEIARITADMFDGLTPEQMNGKNWDAVFPDCIDITEVDADMQSQMAAISSNTIYTVYFIIETADGHFRAVDYYQGEKGISSYNANTSLSQLSAQSADQEWYYLKAASAPASGNSKTTDVTYTVDAAYTVTIPANVTLKDTNVTEKIEFSDVKLAKDQKISVKLTGATNKDLSDESDFNVAQTDTTVFAAYTVTDGASTPKVYALGDEVAAFTYDGTATEAEQNLTFTAPQGASYAGTYTDQLTFTIGVEAAAPAAPQTQTLTVGGVTFTYVPGQKWSEIELPSGVTRNGNVQYDSYDYLYDDTMGDLVHPDSTIDPSHHYVWYTM